MQGASAWGETEDSPQLHLLVGVESWASRSDLRTVGPLTNKGTMIICTQGTVGRTECVRPSRGLSGSSTGRTQ